jgi:valyl-tRNA synthetase
MTNTDTLMKASDTSGTAYNPAEIEAKWTKFWFEQEVFELDIQPDKPRFSAALPPPNITGNLHMGHALNGTLQDVLIRLKRMQGYSVLWQPGTDHAGISTQMVVERQLKKEGRSRQDLGRDAFITEVWKWRHQYGNQILAQYKRLGVSFNWDRVAFTMDAPYVKAIYRAFVQLYNEGYIYRGTRVTNWCPSCLTSLSDLEVQHEQTQGNLYFIKYALEEVTDKDVDGITVATTRPESLFGDVAVAVHPDDDRYKKFIGKRVILPLAQRKIPIIADEYVDREFGTGALKITPGHDVNDWEVGQRHALPSPVVIDAQGKLIHNEFVPRKYRGMERFTAREATVADLRAKGLLVEVQDDYMHGLGRCDRCGEILEPQLSDQWYLRMEELAEPAIKTVEDGEVVFIPERYTASYLDWMRNIRDWNISRQLWWGQRIPVWTCQNCSTMAAFEETPTACTKCGSKNLEQDQDVLDTWFSSGLWPFVTLGWPAQTLEMTVFYPTTILSTARDIINLWVARMIFLSLKLVNKIPFKQVLIHPVIQTAEGKRMSKSKGTAVDPLEMIDKYGSDASRFWFTSIGIKGDQDVRFREQKLEEYKRFVNKLWNAGNFVLGKIAGSPVRELDKQQLTLADRWILHRYNELLKKLDESYIAYDFQLVAKELYEFTWDQFCAWYLEIAKIQIDSAGPKDQTKQVLQIVFEGLLRALHPIMPFVTEELWSRTPKSLLFNKLISIMFAPYPRPNPSFEDQKAEAEMGVLIKVVRSIRNILKTYNVPASSKAIAHLVCQSEEERKMIVLSQPHIERLSGAALSFNADGAATSPHTAVDNISGLAIRVPLDELIDIPKAVEKLLQRKNSIEKDLARNEEVFNNEEFRQKAPPDKVENLKIQGDDLRQQLEIVVEQLKVLGYDQP